MKRRSLLASLAAIFAAPFVAKAEAKPRYKVVCDPVLNPGEADRHSISIVRLDPDGGVKTIAREPVWPPYGSEGRISEHPTNEEFHAFLKQRQIDFEANLSVWRETLAKYQARIS
jgi:hypothetical protein